MKVAKIVYWSPMTRVVVDNDATDEEIYQLAKIQMREILENEFVEHAEAIVDDMIIPYDEKFDN